MIKQWKNENLGVTYFYLPNSKNGEILTSDGVLIPYDEFKSMTSETYNAKKNTNGGYDYTLSKQSERLVKKALNVKKEKESTLTSSSTQTTKPTVVSKPTPIKRVKNPIQSVEKTKEILKPKTVEKVAESKEVEKTVVPKIETVIEPKKIESVVETKKVEEKPKVEKEKNEFNLFEFIYPKLMIALMIVCSILSIYFTGTYLQRLQTPIIAYAISTAMLIYGLVGSQMTRKAWRNNHKLSAFIFGFTTICTIGFSMTSSIDVNYSKYKKAHQSIEETYNSNDGKKLSYDLLKDELADNKQQIELLNEDIKFQQTQWTIIWDNELNKNVVIEGRISATAQNKISEDRANIEKLNIRNKELNEKLREYAESGVSVESIESKTDRAKTLTDLIGSLIKVSGNVIQLIFLLIPSFFIDAINILALQIYCQKFEEKEEND